MSGRVHGHVPGVGHPHLRVDGQVFGGRKREDEDDVVGVRKQVERDDHGEELDHPGALKMNSSFK